MALVGLLAFAACSDTRAVTPPEQTETVRRFVAILDYVAADYAVAVADGKIIDQAEYDEQIAFMRDAQEIATSLGSGGAAAELAATSARIQELVVAKAPPAEVAAAARALRRKALEVYGIVLAPSAPPSRDRGAELYAVACATCHGATGAADGPGAVGLDPAPRSFRDPEVMKDLFPARAFNTVTDGVPGTGMASFGTLSASDRWSLAFFVFSLRHEDAAAVRGADAWTRTRHAVAGTPTRLAGLSDGEIDAKLAQAGVAAGDRSDILAYLRREAPFRLQGAPLDASRKLLQAGVTAYRAGDPRRARDLVAQAYLDGFDPYEGALRTRDGGLVTAIEQRFMTLRQRIIAGEPVDSVDQEYLALGLMLDRAEEKLGTGSSAGAATTFAPTFASALLIILREGVEAALLIMLLLGMTRRDSNDAAEIRGDHRAVHLGWLLAAGLGVATWFVSGLIVDMGGGRREIMEGVVSLIAAAALLAAGHWVLARLDAMRRVEAIKRRIRAATSGASRRWALAGLAFLAVFREAFEVVLFLRTIALDAGSSSGALLAGVGAGSVLLVGAVFALVRLGRRVKPGPLLAGMGTLLCVLAVIFAGKGIHALQAADVLPARLVSLPVVEWLGLYPTVQGVVAQLLVLGAFVAIAGVAMLRSRARTAEAVSPVPPQT